MNNNYDWTDNPTVSGVALCDTDVLNDCLMHLKYDNEKGNGFSLFDIVAKDHVLSLEESKGFAELGSYVYNEAVTGRYGYPDFYNRCLEEFQDAVQETITVGSYSFTGYKNANGHIFYNISDKGLVDAIYSSTGFAWYYGIDTENERIFLPRNNWFFQSGNAQNVGKFVEAGLPNITGTIKSGANGSDYLSGAFKYLNSENNGVSGRHDGGSDANYVSGTAKFDASASSSIYGNSNTVQPAAVKMLLYIVVGNTEQQSAITDVTEITTSENDTIPLFTGLYFDFTPNNASWLKAGTQKNSGGIYTTAYNTLVNCLTEANNIYNIKVIDVADMEADVDYSEYWKVNQIAMTFTTPATIGLNVSNLQLYFKVANAVENLELLDAGEVLEHLTDKVDYTNTEWATDACMPDYSAPITITSPYTTPCDGYLYLRSYNGMQRWINTHIPTFSIFYTANGNSAISGASWSVIPVGTTITKDWEENEGDASIFFPMKGATNA